MADPKTIKITSVVVGVFGLIMSAVAIWAMVAPYKIGGLSAANSDLAGQSAKLALSAGIFSIVLAAFTFWAKLEDKMHLGVLTFSLVLVLVLSIAALAIAIRDLNQGKRLAGTIPESLLDMLLKRYKGVAGISGISCIPQIVDLVFVIKNLI